MQASYPKKLPTPSWDTSNVEYPVRKFPATPVSSETIARRCIGQPEVIKSLRNPLDALKDYLRDYNVTKDLTRSQTSLDYGFKQPEVHRFNKHTSCVENHYIYPPSRRLAERPPQCTAHGTTEMRSSFTIPTVSSRLVTDKDQFKHPACLPPNPPAVEPSFHKELPPLDTTHDGFEKYLDPYLTTSLLQHRPYTADQLNRPSASKDIITFYTFADVPLVRTPKAKIQEWQLPISQPKSMYNREQFKKDFREIRTHNKLRWVPGTFRTETRDNYVAQSSRPESKTHNQEEDVRTYYERYVADLPTNTSFENTSIQRNYSKENSHVGSGQAVCSVIDQYRGNNKRLEMKNMRIC